MAGGKTYPAIRYEAFVFDDVLYKRKGRLQVWITDDADRLPVMFRCRWVSLWATSTSSWKSRKKQ